MVYLPQCFENVYHDAFDRLHFGEARGLMREAQLEAGSRSSLGETEDISCFCCVFKDFTPFRVEPQLEVRHT